MLDFIFVVLFIVMSYRIFRAIRAEEAIFREFNQSQILSVFSLLFPIGPVALIIGSFKFPVSLACALAAFCYLPSLIVARRQSRAFESAGTDRINRAQTAISQALGTSLVGLVYVGFSFTLFFASNAIS